MKQEKEKEKLVTLIYNGEKEMIVNRKRVSSACFYFQRLLEGPFKESKLSRININLGDSFSYECFEGILLFANENYFVRDRDNYELCSEMIQLASIWMYEEFVNILESHLIDCIDPKIIGDLHYLSNRLNLLSLKEKCLEVEKVMDCAGSLDRKWGRCPLPEHQNHSYKTCPSARTTIIPIIEENWDEDWDIPLASRRLSDEEKEAIADYRDPYTYKYNQFRWAI